ncbi:hypothetical protein GCM10010425_50370 [Streptomyces spororaveus]|uniref:DDE family transposase n=1 Tax=Streptomyces spororaveus TaxID=284039 RepID=A0ABQ3T2M3_9ACTN|nr:hypothetical protein Sspor_01920 [Streptomyces spororaveus]
MTCPRHAARADRAYSTRAIRNHLRGQGIRAVIPQPSDQIGHRLRRGHRGGRPPGFDAEAYNHHRCHTALGGHPPISRVNNAAGQYT